MIVIKEKEYNSNINLLKNDIGSQGNVYFATFQSSSNDVIPDFYYPKGGNYKKEIFTLKEGKDFFSNKKTICVGDGEYAPTAGTTNFLKTDKYIAFLYVADSLSYQYLYFFDSKGEIWKMKINHLRYVDYWLKLDDPNAI